MAIPDGWHSTVRRLKKMMPAPLPVSIRTRKHIPGKLGHCWKMRNRFHIEIEQGCEECMYRTLVHEYSHLFDWHDGIKEHSESWGCWFARVYQVVYETD